MKGSKAILGMLLLTMQIVFMIAGDGNYLPANSQGLQWGVVSGQSLVYELESASLIDNTTIQVKEYVTFEIGVLQEPPVDILMIPSAPFETSWYNNHTSCEILWYFSWETTNAIYHAPPFPAIMKGNWTILGELVEGYNEDPDFLYTVFETPIMWGYNLSIASDDFTATSHNTWFKSNGTQKLKTFDVSSNSGEFIHSSLTLTSLEPVSLTPTVSTPDILFRAFLGAVVFGVVIIVLLALKKRKRT